MVAASEPDIETVDVLPKLNFDVSGNYYWQKEVMNVVLKSNYTSLSHSRAIDLLAKKSSP